VHRENHLVEPVADKHTLDLQQSGGDAEAHGEECNRNKGRKGLSGSVGGLQFASGAWLLRTLPGAGFESGQARFEPVSVLTKLIDIFEEFLDFDAGRNVAAFFLQVLGHVA
jgi:hypothetical protein